jgi:hypothetical protein
LFPFADTPNPGGVYIMAICKLPASGSVNPRDCKYDAFKVRPGAPNVNAQLSGMKFEDLNRDGVHDLGEPGIQNWQITINCFDATPPFTATVTTDEDGNWSYATPLHSPTSGTTTCEVSEVQQGGYSQSAPQSGYTGFTESGGATAAVTDFMTYMVTIPNDAVSAVSGLLFGNAVSTEGDN